MPWAHRVRFGAPLRRYCAVQVFGPPKICSGACSQRSIRFLFRRACLPFRSPEEEPNRAPCDLRLRSCSATTRRNARQQGRNAAGESNRESAVTPESVPVTTPSNAVGSQPTIHGGKLNNSPLLSSVWLNSTNPAPISTPITVRAPCPELRSDPTQNGKARMITSSTATKRAEARPVRGLEAARLEFVTLQVSNVPAQVTQPIVSGSAIARPRKSRTTTCARRARRRVRRSPRANPGAKVVPTYFSSRHTLSPFTLADSARPTLTSLRAGSTRNTLMPPKRVLADCWSTLMIVSPSRTHVARLPARSNSSNWRKP